MDTNRGTPEHIDQGAADPGKQWIPGGKGHHPSPGNLAEQRREPLAQRSWPWQPLLRRKRWDQVKVSRAPQQHLRVLDRGPQPLRKVDPSPCGQPHHLNHASDCMPAASPASRCPHLS